jgi:hypothetical protein
MVHTIKMWTFLRDHNYKVSKHVTTNMLMAIVVMMSSVFAYGFDNSVISTVQAMTGTLNIQAGAHHWRLYPYPGII